MLTRGCDRTFPQLRVNIYFHKVFSVLVFWYLKVSVVDLKSVTTFLKDLHVRLSKVELALSKKLKKSGPSPAGDIFKNEWLNRYGVNYPSWSGKEAAQIKRWAVSVGLDKYESLIKAYFSWNDPYIVKAGHPLGLMVTQTTRLVSDMTRATEKIQSQKQYKQRQKEIEQDIDWEDLKQHERQLSAQSSRGAQTPERQLQDTTKNGVLEKSDDIFNEEV